MLSEVNVELRDMCHPLARIVSCLAGSGKMNFTMRMWKPVQLGEIGTLLMQGV